MTVCVSLERATGAIVLHLILYFLPSTANVLLRPSKPSFAKMINNINLNSVLKLIT